MSKWSFLSCCIGRDDVRLSTNQQDYFGQNEEEKDYLESQLQDRHSFQGLRPEAAARKKAKKKKNIQKPSILQTHNAELVTPGGPNFLYEEPESFDHEYYKFSMKIIELMVNGKSQKVAEMGLDKQVYLSEVFYEQPLADEDCNKQEAPFVTRNELASRKETEKRRFLEVKKKGNNSEQLYLISVEWVNMWVYFISTPDGTLPGEIINDMLYLKYKEKNDLHLGKDCLLISKELWDLYHDWYGGEPILKWKIQDTESNEYKMRTSRSPLIKNQPLLPEYEAKKKKRSPSKWLEEDDEEEEKSPSLSTPKNKLRKSAMLEKPRNGITVLDTREGLDLMDVVNSGGNPLRKKQTKIYEPEKEIVTRRPEDDEEEEEQEYYRDKQLLRVFGLENSRFYCYFNACLQCLFAIQELRIYYENQQFKQVPVRRPMNKGMKFSQALQNFTYQIDRASKVHGQKVVKTVMIRKLIQNDFTPAMEHDSHEFLLYFLNNLKDELTEKGMKLSFGKETQVEPVWDKYMDNFPSIVDKLFTMIEKSTNKCKSCKNVTFNLQPYLTIPLHVEKMKTIQDSLSEYCKVELVKDYHCEKCNKKSATVELSKKILKLPEVIIFQMQRFAMYPTVRKIRGQIKYQEFIDMSPYIDPEAKKSPLNSPLYELQAVAVHMGTIFGGHYVAYAKKEDEQWYCMNDERVGRVSKQEVLQQDAYLLFYRRSRNN